MTPSQRKLNIWMLKFLLGTLSKNKTDILKKELARKTKDGNFDNALERKFAAAFAIDRPTRQYLAELLDDWEKRS